MALFQQSSITYLQAATRVAETAGASGSTSELLRARYSVQQAMEYWDTARNWNFLLSDVAAPFEMIAPVTVTNCDVNTSDGVVTTGGGQNFDSVAIYDVVTGDLIKPETVVSVAPSGGPPTTTLTMSRAATAASASATLVFYRRDYALPADFKTMYSMRTVGSPRTLDYLDMRFYDRAVHSQTRETPTHYTLFLQGTEGLVRFIPTPIAADAALMKYYRKLTIPSDDGTALDIPQRYEFGIISLAKAYYLADKGGEADRQKFWYLNATDILRRAIGEDVRISDRDEGFMPGAMLPWPSNPNSVREWLRDW